MRKLFDRTPAEAAVVLRTLKAVATAEGLLPMDDVHRATLEALRDHVLRAPVDVDKLPVTLPEELERRILDPEVRANLVHLAIAIPFLEPEHEPERAAVVRSVARCFRVSDRDVADADRAARGHYARMALDASRGSLAEISGTSFKRSLGLYLRGMVHRDADPAMAARVHAFASHPGGTVGRHLLDYWRDNEFGLPGDPGSMQSQVFFKHDVHHVLTGYDTSPRGELALAGFYTGAAGKDYAGFTAMLLLQLQVAVQVDPTVAAWRDQFDADLYFAGLERAERCRVDVVGASFDPWSVVDRPLAEVRREIGIPEERAMVRGPSDRWCGDLGPPGKRVSPDKLREARL